MSRKLYLMVTPYFPRPDNEWTCSFTYDQAVAIEKTGRYRVVIINPNYNGNYAFKDIQVLGFKERHAGRWLVSSLYDWLNARQMFRILLANGISPEEIVVAHGHLITSASYVWYLKQKNKKIKALLQIHDPDPYGMLLGTGRLGWLKKVLYFIHHRALAEQMDLMIAISQNVAKVIVEAPQQSVFNTYIPMKRAMRVLQSFRRAHVRRVDILPNGVNRGIFSEGDGDYRVQRLTHSFTIGCVAVFRDWKDQLTLLHAIECLRQRIPDVMVKLVGVHHSGTMMADCQKLIEEKNLPVEIIPSVNHTDLPGFYRSLDLFVLPSYFEGFGCVFLEAWSCGTPFITCEGQGMDDYIAFEDRALWLCKQQDPQDLAQKILHYYKNRQRQRLVGETDIDVMIPKFLDAVESI